MYHDATIAKLASIQVTDNSNSGMMGHILGAILREVSAEREAQRKVENRRAVEREIAGLPAKLRYDLAFSDRPFETDHLS